MNKTDKATEKLKRCVYEIDNILEQIAIDDTVNNLTNDEKSELKHKALYQLEYTFSVLCREFETEHMDRFLAENGNVPQELKDEEYQKVWNKMLSRVPDNLFKFEKYGKGYRAVLPMLVSYRSKSHKAFSAKNWFSICVFESLLKQNLHIITRMEEATVLFVFYQKKHNNIIRDNDNSDSHGIINLINKHILSTDDNGLRVSLAYESRISEIDIPYTEVYILPKADLLTLYTDGQLIF